MIKRSTSREMRARRHRRVRVKVVGTPSRPRLSVFRSSQHVYAQLVDDSRGHTLVAASSREKGVLPDNTTLNPRQEAELVGQALAKRAQEHGLKAVVFDRGGYPYHGRVKALAEAARKAGLEF
jgi:large subunit ribosomal protein L18